MKNIDAEQLVKEVKQRYAKIAAGREASCCVPASSSESTKATSCCGTTATEVSGGLGYKTDELQSLPEGANMGLGCGAPVDHLDLKPGEVVLDLGSGGGIDAFLAAKRVGPDGKVIGVDMTPEMIECARQNAESAGIDHVEFRLGRLEDLPVENDSVDAVTSNCVINLVPDKQQVYYEIARVLKPGGRLVISDVVLDGLLPESLASDLLAYVGCVAGAMQREAYFTAVEAAGLTDIEILSDVDFVAATEDHIPDDITDLMESTGIGLNDVRGKVHSVTFRAARR
ncbi:MAG: arsenite methyltransferase [Gemmatimonadetes bacterium]|nr:arsenite methyltransferase [Gemmatimonadota bacterium]